MTDHQIPERELGGVLAALKQTLALSGDVVEFGCYTGDTSVELARVLKNYPEKWLWLYDSFAGLPAKSPHDIVNLPANRAFKPGALRASPTTVRAKFKKYHLPEPLIKAAWFADLDPVSDLPAQISFALLDGDFYDSIKTSLNLVFLRLVPGGIIVVHDYHNPSLPGSARAVKEFLKNHPSNFTFRGFASLAIIKKLITD